MANVQNMVETIFKNMNPWLIVYVVISGIVSVSVFLLTIYFSMVLSKSLIPFQKHQGLIFFITFIIMNILINYISFKVSDFLPVRLPSDGLNLNIGMVKMGNIVINNNTTILSLGSLLFNLAVSVFLFIGAYYLIDNKLEL